MKLLQNVSAIALAVGASLAVNHAAPAQAASRIFSLEAGPGISGTADTILTFDRFDSALGTLTGVVFSLASDKPDLFASVSGSFSSGEGGTASARTTSLFEVADVPSGNQIFGASNGTAQSTCTGAGASCVGPAPDEVNLPVFSALTQTFELDLSEGEDLSRFKKDGADTQFDIRVFVQFETTVFTCLQGSSSAGADCSVSGGASWAGSVDVEFLFDPAVEPSPVPAPATLGLLGAGLIGLGVTRRRRN